MTTWTEPAFEEVAAFVSRRTGLSFAQSRDGAESGMRRAMARTRIRDPRQYAGRIAADEDAFDDLLDELTVGETYFFREPAHFQFIRDRIVPEIPDRAVRAWSAACASGEEAYSLAILFEQAGLGDRTFLAGTDISRAALAKAGEAVYGDWSLRGEGALAALPYLIREGKSHRLSDRIRNRVRFSPLNLALDSYPSYTAGIWGMDLILCRNVLIYFDKESVRQTAKRLHETLADGGWLITASSDPPLWDHAPFEVVNVADGLFYRKSGGNARTMPWVDVGHVDSLRAGDCGQDATPPTPPSDKGGNQTVFAGTTSEFRDQGPLSPRDDFHSSEEAVRFPPLSEGGLGGGAPSGNDQPLVNVPTAESEVRRVRTLANVDPASAVEACAEATARYPLSAELHYLHAVLLLDRDRPEEAVRAMRRVIYLDRTLAVAHLTLGAILRRLGDWPGAARAYRNARDVCAARPADEAVPMADGESAGRLAEIAASELEILNGKG